MCWKKQKMIFKVQRMASVSLLAALAREASSDEVPGLRVTPDSLSVQTQFAILSGGK